MELLNLFNPAEVRHFLLILARVSTFLFLLPFFSSETFPNQVKAALSLVLTLALFGAVRTDPAAFPLSPIAFIPFLGTELFVGMLLGLSVRIFFASVQLAGLLAGFQMGFSMINVVDPQSGSQVSLMEQFGFWILIVLFLMMNGHLLMVGSLVNSFETLPMGSFHLTENLHRYVMTITRQMFETGICVGAPVTMALLLVSVCFGITAKFAPQMNIMMVAFPVKILIGLVGFGLSLTFVSRHVEWIVRTLSGQFAFLLKTLGGG